MLCTISVSPVNLSGFKTRAPGVFLTRHSCGILLVLCLYEYRTGSPPQAVLLLDGSPQVNRYSQILL